MDTSIAVENQSHNPNRHGNGVSTTVAYNSKMKKERRYIILKISNKGVFYNDKEFIQWGNTNFPSKDSFNFNDRLEIFWKVELISFNKKNKELGVDVVDYKVLNKKDQFIIQKPKYLIERLKFKNLKWVELEKLMNWFTRNKFNKISDSKLEESKKRETINLSPKDVDLRNVKIDLSRNVKFKVQHSLMKTKFKMGFVEIEKRINGIPDKVKLILQNPHIIPEFDHVKPFFAKAIGKRKIEITGTAHIDENGQININCQSEEINLINEELITSVKRLKLKDSILNPKVVTVDKSLFTPDEYFDSDEDNLLGNTLRKTDKDLLDEIFRIEEIRNKKHLIYLSGKLQSNKTRLRFTLSPKFGFLFHVEGNEMDHFIWELLDSHATYIWSIEREGIAIDKKFQLLEKEINFIRDNGRMVFLRNQTSSNFVFSKINHGSSGSNLIDDFPKWKLRVNEKLV